MGEGFLEHGRSGLRLCPRDEQCIEIEPFPACPNPQGYSTIRGFLDDDGALVSGWFWARGMLFHVRCCLLPSAAFLCCFPLLALLTYAAPRAPPGLGDSESEAQPFGTGRAITTARDGPRLTVCNSVCAAQQGVEGFSGMRSPVRQAGGAGRGT